MIIAFFWFILSFVVAGFGSSKNIGGVGAFFISLFFSPIIGFIAVIASKDKMIIRVCKHCQQKNVVTTIYCSRCGRDDSGLTIEENKLKFPAKA